MHSEPSHKTFELPIATSKAALRNLAAIELPGVCRCALREIGRDPALAVFERRENYGGRRRTGSRDDSIALEAELFLSSEGHPDWTSLRIGVPLSEIPDSGAIAVRYSGTHFQLLCGGAVLDEEFPFGDPPGDPLDFAGSYSAVSALPAGTFQTPLHGWSPASLSAWVGDVSAGVFDGEFHLFYLYDRRHHRSKFGQGGHQWGHLATRDFRTFRDDGIVLPMEAQWQSFGTGTPFRLGGKPALAYGFHTERFHADGAGFPAGASWAASPDGVRFGQSGVLFDTTRNPSVYNLPGNRFRLYTGYGDNLRMLEADRWPEFRTVRERVLPCGEASPARNRLDCPAWFEWDGTHYMLLGFSGMWMADSPDFARPVDLSARGDSLYDGLEVPMDAALPDGRRVLAGWLPFDGWGGILGIRELVRHPDGVLGIRWLAEAMPDVPPMDSGTASPDPRGDEATMTIPGNALLDRTIPPGQDVAVRLEDSQGDFVELRVNAAAGRACLVRGKAAAPELTLPEPPSAALSANFRGRLVTNLRGLGAPWRLRLMVRSEQKWDGSVVDAEFAGYRTLLRYFHGFHAVRCAVTTAATASFRGER